MEYDLNVFYEDLGEELSDVYTIQPSVYVYTKDDRALRMYLEAFKLDLIETRAIAPDFPEEEWGSDFFLSLDTFYDICQALPKTVQDKLSKLPSLDAIDFNSEAPEVNWIN
jgi:hypothetical protein